MNVQNKHLKIIAQISGSLNAFIFLMLFITFSKISDYLPHRVLDFVVNNFLPILNTAFILIVISIIAALSVTKREKQEKYDVFFVYLVLTIVNVFAFMLQHTLSEGFNGPVFG
jgi:membrane-associated HD superfamily phosphohydrolase